MNCSSQRLPIGLPNPKTVTEPPLFLRSNNCCASKFETLTFVKKSFLCVLVTLWLNQALNLRKGMNILFSKTDRADEILQLMNAA